MLLRCSIIGFIVVFCGLAKAQNAPVTSAPDFFGAVPGQITVPVTVTNFTDIGAVSLNLEYDPTVLTFVLGIQNSTINGMFAIGDNALPSGMRRVAIGWFGNAESLPDGASLVDLQFNYLGGTTDLDWFDDGASCEYTDEAYNTLNDVPVACHYRNGIVTSSRCMNLSVYLEGLYSQGTHQMISALGSVPDLCDDGLADNIQVEFRSASDYSNVVFASADISVSMQGIARVLVPASLSNGYYITIRHRNSVATVSAVPVLFSSNIVDYNFTDMASKAYGNNMIRMGEGIWAIYAGDVNQDGFVDTGDMTPVDNDAGNFEYGYLPTDVNGDGFVDTGDMTIIDNNVSGFVGSITP